MKKIFFVLGMLIIGLTSSLLNAQTYVSGIISSNTIWTMGGNPYIVTGNTLVNNGITLTIEPGVIVKFDSLMALQINGKLLAIGISGNKITFTSNKSTPAAGDWGFLSFSNSSTSGSILEYCIIEYAGSSGGTSSSGAVVVDNAYPLINYCTIQHNKGSGIYAYNLTDTLKITNNVISNNSATTGGGMEIHGGYAIISNNSISDNYATTGGGGGIYISSNTSEIFNNYILNNTAVGGGPGGGGGGMNIEVGTSTITNNIIKNNQLTGTIFDQGGGIKIYVGTATISHNAIIGNLAGEGGGIIGDGSVQIYNNIVTNNIASSGGGIYGSENISNNSIINNSAQNHSAIRTGASGNLTYNTFVGNIATGSTPLFTIHIISHPLFNQNNTFSNTATYELYNGNSNTSANLDAKNNWWGTSNDAEIQQKIYDWFDDANLGIVDYIPYLITPDTIAPVSPPANVIKSNIGGGQVKITWIANPETDVAGYRVYYGGFTGHSFTNAVNVGNDTSYILSSAHITDTIGVTAYDNIYSPANEYDSTIVNDNMINGNESWFTIAVDTSSTGITQNENEIPKLYVLHQNFPNPFNPTTTISYQIPELIFVTLKVYDVLGSEVATLVNEEKPLGTYELTWYAENLPSGIYFYRLQAGSFVENKKMVLMK